MIVMDATPCQIIRFWRYCCVVWRFYDWARCRGLSCLEAWLRGGRGTRGPGNLKVRSMTAT